MKNGDWKSEIEDNKRFREIGSKNVKSNQYKGTMCMRVLKSRTSYKRKGHKSF
jgi:hypothetical protein